MRRERADIPQRVGARHVDDGLPDVEIGLIELLARELDDDAVFGWPGACLSGRRGLCSGSLQRGPSA